MQTAFLTALAELAAADRNVLFMTADNGTDYDILFSRNYPEQYFNLGIAENNLVGMAAGCASCGKVPFVMSGSAFLAFRSCEQIRNDVCLQRRSVKLAGFGVGVSIARLGPTHHATEDIGVLCAMPGLTVFSPATPKEVARAVRAAYTTEGPVYIRMEMNGEPEFEAETAFAPGEPVLLADGSDAVVLTTGSIWSEAMAGARDARRARLFATGRERAYAQTDGRRNARCRGKRDTARLHARRAQRRCGLGMLVRNAFSSAGEHVKIDCIGC
jgi:transketolase